MTTLRDAAKQALEALELARDYAEGERLENERRYKGYEHLAPDDAYAVGQIDNAITALRAALAQEQTLEQEPSNPKEKEMTDPNSISFNLNTDALPVEWLRLDGSGFHYKGKVIEDAGEAYDLFKQWLAIAHQQPSAQRLTIEKLRDALVASRVIDSDAVEDPDDYDDGVTLARIEALFRRIA